ncbi:MAG: redox-sensing transcriptional repressor Rex [Acidimicrobiia bacterium]
MPELPIPRNTVRRLPVYLAATRVLQQDFEFIASHLLAEVAGVHAAQVRRDLSYVEKVSRRGRGYEVASLIRGLEDLLHTDEETPVVIVGAGKLGGAVAGYERLEQTGHRVVALFDVNPAKIGRSVNGVPVRALDELPSVVAESGAKIGVVATPPSAGSEAATRLRDSGIRSILTFVPIERENQTNEHVRMVDVATEMQILDHYRDT